MLLHHNLIVISTVGSSANNLAFPHRGDNDNHAGADHNGSRDHNDNSTGNNDDDSGVDDNHACAVHHDWLVYKIYSFYNVTFAIYY